jgi:hypothetical protein
MKQRITPEQLNELTDEQKEKLRELWKDDRFSNGFGDCYLEITPRSGENTKVWFSGRTQDLEHWIGQIPNKNYDLPLLSIGQMIEILEHPRINPIPPGLIDPAPSLLWMVTFGLHACHVVDYEAEELADALWQATKIKLQWMIEAALKQN